MLIQIGERQIGPGKRTYIVAEISANHDQRFEHAAKLVELAKNSGADAVKVQTYTADTLTIQSNRECFRLSGGTLWDGRTLYDLYGEASMPWEWQPKLKSIANSLGLDFFSTPFDVSAVDFLEEMKVPAFKVASFEIVDLPLIRRIARTKKPMILSSGMATRQEINEAVSTFRQAGGEQLALLKCTSAYPARADEMNLRTISHMAKAFKVPVGLSDHTLGTTVPVAGVALGACLVEKHFTSSRALKGPDSSFSLEPEEFREMVLAIQIAEQAVGAVHYGASVDEEKSLRFRRSLFVLADMKAGEAFTRDNVGSIRPWNGLHTRYLEEIIGRVAARDIERGTPLAWELISDERTFLANSSRTSCHADL
ncbi:MAG TPA: pseudaminic acid synthase [Candidatus Binatia bacterium]